MAIRHANAVWQGNLKEGAGNMKLGSGLFEGPFTYASRFEEGDGTNPDELVGAALAGCYSMFLSALLSGDNHTPTRIDTDATVHLDQVEGAPAITTIELSVEAEAPGVDEDEFQEYAENAKNGCPVSKALAGVEIKLSAELA